ncbi:MAG: hypothetical protein GY903_00555 [Fuerstiella sp.]|nr:hypothetical protein [Fuerstiella sp.]MCP4785208.1 hypothetical protein [Fuerstiella sp.]MCP4852968.1 hypothetical protein [Fuerstiella sp.]
MSEERSTLETLMGHLRQERDELRLKMHLAEMEAKDEYDRLSGKLDELTVQYDPVRTAVSESADNVISALALAAGEMKNGFQRVRKALKSD